MASQNSDLYQSVKWFQWLSLTGTASRFFGFGVFEEKFLNSRLDWVCMGVL